MCGYKEWFCPQECSKAHGDLHTPMSGCKDKVPGEVSLMFIGYNLSRCVSILGASHLIKALKECYLLYSHLLDMAILSLFGYLKNKYGKNLRLATPKN